MATIESLAPEILADIFELAHDPHKPSTMCAAALVCRAWRDPAQRTLFQDVVLTRPLSVRWNLESSTLPAPLVAHKNWETYRDAHPPTPRQAELWGLSAITAGAPVLQCLPGTRSLIVTDCIGSFAFLSDDNLRDLEHLHLQRGTWSSGSIRWTVGLRSLRMGLWALPWLVWASHPSPALALLILEIEDMNSPYDVQDCLGYIPATVTDLTLILYVPNDIPDLIPAFATVQKLHHLTFSFDPARRSNDYTSTSALLQSIAGSLPASIKRLSITNVRGAADRTHIALCKIPLAEIKDLFANDRLPSLTRLDFPDCKRKDLEDEAAAADLLAECERRSIRVVCWEEFI